MEKDYQHHIIDKYFITAGVKNADVRIEKKRIDVVINGIFGEPHILIEFKEVFNNRDEINKALTQIVLSAEKYQIKGKYYGVFGKYENDDIFVFFEHDVDIFKSMAINVNAEKFDIQEKPSNPSPEAITNITAALKGKTKEIRNNEIIPIITTLINNKSKLTITEKNVDIIFMRWCEEITFDEQLKSDDDRSNLFLTDILNETTYNRVVKKVDLLEAEPINTQFVLLKEKEKVSGFLNKMTKFFYTIENIEYYNKFWSIYDRPPDEKTFLKIYEKRHIFFSEKHRKETGAQYTPKILVDLQTKILNENLESDWQEKYVIFDCCCGSANLQENIINKSNVYLSTLEQGDIFLAKSKGFDNVIKFNFLEDDKMPKFNYQNQILTINEIAKKENKEILVIINPPYEKEMFIEFVEKIVKNIPNCKLFLYSPFGLYEKDIYFERLQELNPIILTNILVNARIFEELKDWGLSMSFFEFKEKNKTKLDAKVKSTRYELKINKNKEECLEKQKNKVISCPNKISYKKYLESQLKAIDGLAGNNEKIIKLGNYSIMSGGLVISNLIDKKYKPITNNNIKEILIASGILYNTDLKYYERESIKAPSKKLSNDFITNCIISALFYKNNKTMDTAEYKNYFFPFSEKEIGIPNNKLSAYFEDGKFLFDFREWLEPYKKEMSVEAKELFDSALEVYKFYFRHFGRDRVVWNVGFMQLKDSLMQDTTKIKKLDTTKTSLTGAAARIGENAYWRPSILDRRYNTNIFSIYDNALLNLFTKIQDQMIEHGILETRMATLR
ncbi:MAG: hypothetical protein Ta2D_04660 [Rickettsiales bacterium]|nr:MAG: hypothetical protein Ta2D_04660 [Rickettsiales bacterium]